MHSTPSRKPSNSKDQEAVIAALQAEIASLQATLGQDEDAEDIVSKHIKLLHEYNEAKDATQILIGKLASHKEVTVRQLHADYGLMMED